MSTYVFHEDADTRQVTCSIMPSEPGEISAFKLKMALSESEFKGVYVFNENVDPLVAEAMTAIAERARESSPGDQAERALASGVVAERRDGHAEVKISDDSMVADVMVITACGGESITESRIREALSTAGVVRGIQDQPIGALVAEAHESPGGQHIKRKVAEGTPPGAGKPSRFENLVVPFQDRVLKPKELDGGNIDLLDLGDIDTVTPGQALVRRHPAEAGPDGHTVTGEAIASEVPKETEFAVGDGTEISENDPHLLVATCNGIPHRLKNGMSIDDVLQTEEVGLRTGHIDLEGNLLVKGDVRPGMKVKVTGNLTVLGFVESAIVEAGGDVTIRNGIIGPPPNSSEHLCEVSGRNIESKYAQNAKLVATADIRLSSHMLHCEAQCHSIFVGSESSRDARLAGGSVQAENTVAASVLGAEAGTQTRISFDGRVLEMMARLTALHEQQQAKSQLVTQLAESLKKLAALPKPSDDMREKIKRVRNTIDQYQQDAMGLAAEQDALHAEIDEVRRQCHVSAWHAIHSGVELHCAGVHHRFGSDRGAGTLGVRDGSWRRIDAHGEHAEA